MWFDTLLLAELRDPGEALNGLGILAVDLGSFLKVPVGFFEVAL